MCIRDRLETGMPADKLGELFSAYARPYSLTEARSENSGTDKVKTKKLNAYRTNAWRWFLIQ